MGRCLRAILSAHGCAFPDGRALFKYDLSADEIVTLRGALIEAFRGHLPETPTLTGAAFCLWAAHWFRHEFTGGQWSWTGVAASVGAPNDPTSRERLVTAGLGYLKRMVRRTNGAREFLATIVLEGGFPSRLIEEDGGWLSRYIEAVTLAASQGENTLDTALDHATFYQSMIPQTFRAPSLCHLAADLAYNVAILRRKLSDNGITEGAIEWLDGVEPGWRERLPMAARDEAARKLVEVLVRARAKAAAMPVACRRLLKANGDGTWSPALSLQIEGRIEEDELPSRVKNALASATRARILPTGVLEAKGLPALGVANRAESSDWKGWEVESFFGSKPKVVADFPLDADVRLMFSIGGGPVIEFVPSGGCRITSEILVFRDDNPVDGAEATRLALIATGSIKDRDKILYVAVPRSAALTGTSDGNIVDIGAAGNLVIFKVLGAVDVEVDGDHFHVQSNADRAASARIDAIGEMLSGASSNYPIYCGCPKFLIHNGVLKSHGDRKSLQMRSARRGESWKPFLHEALPLGVVEVAALDGGAILDRLTFVHVPRNAKVAVSVPSPGNCRIDVTGLSTTSLQQVGANAVSSAVSDGFAFRMQTVAARPEDINLRARWGSTETILTIAALAEKLAFYDGKGVVIPNHATLSMSDLRGASAEAVERSSILITVMERRHTDRSLSVDRSFERTLPFSQIRDDVDRLFAMTDELDAEVKIEAINSAKTASVIRLRRFDLTLEPDDENEVTLTNESMRRLLSDGTKEIWVYGRPFGDMGGADRKLETYRDETGLHWIVPDGEGPWFVYAKADGITRSRPLHINRKLSSQAVPSALLEAVMTANQDAREGKIVEVLKDIGDSVDVEAGQVLTAFIGTVDPALPLQSFDVFRLRPLAPRAAVRLAVNCDEATLYRILDIDEKLPFSWFATNPLWWSAALWSIRQEYIEKLNQSSITNSSLYADEVVRKKIHEIARNRPCMSTHMAISCKSLGLKPTDATPQRVKDAYAAIGVGPVIGGILSETLREKTSIVRTRNDGRNWPTPLNFRGHVDRLPTTKFESAGWANPVIDAPCAAAAIAQGRLPWSLEIERAIRMCRAFDPSYFEEALLVALSIGWIDAPKPAVMAS